MKFIDIKGFATAFANYDIVAKRSRVYGLIYPFIELSLGLLYLFKFWLVGAAWITVVIMGVGIIGVSKNLLSKNPVKCACLGTKLPVPLTKFTFFEDLAMGIMGVILLLTL